ncbi:SPOR domain-containing protein [Viridibacterium curvum]|uniref:SPOR domain-containing protein n=1 Tax=Viridibacterium curvum TaxID=1101404 RepID=A0ABP9R4D7_9RHOO
MPEVLQQAREEDALRRSRQHMMIKIALAAAVALIVILALILSESSTTTEPAPTAQVVKPITAAPRADNPPAESLEEAARRALKTSEEAAQIQSAVLADQKAMPQAASAVPEETTDPTATALGVPASAPAAARAESSGRLVLGQTKRPAAAASSAKPPAAPEPVTRGAGPVAPAVAAAVSGQGSSKTQSLHSTTAASSAAQSIGVTPPAFLVQAGVFANYSNAEELRNKLVAAGIPAQIESRVQIGPFANKQEAAAAQQKLRALGLDGGMLVPRTTGKP